MNLDDLILQYRSHLLDDVVPFWMNNSQDMEFGGFFTCLDRTGKVYDTDKFVWLQCREVWLFAMLYDEVERNPGWLDLAKQGADFLQKYGRDMHGNWYFSLTREGKPLVQPYNIFSDCFACMAFARLHKITDDPNHGEIAKRTFFNILERQDHAKGIYDKTFPGTRPMRSFAMPMILSNLVLEIEHLIDSQIVEKTINNSIDQVTHLFYRPEFGVILENVANDGSFVDSFDGRLVNPGHGLESMWFIMELANRNQNHSLIDKATKIALDLMQYGWDTERGGLFYFMDVKGHPPDKLEWDQKLWWVHQEAMLAMLKGFLYTGNQKCWSWFEKLQDYSWSHFADPEYGEWFGYLNRRGEILVDAKGGKWKGCFHTPRFLFQSWKTLQLIKNGQEKNDEDTK
ncbi:MAG: AGE family epimerase/isomerase [Saprospiraceae bacterium]|nr:AGE family epimerase/isomerase [Saprospiraceae bacterium]